MTKEFGETRAVFDGLGRCFMNRNDDNQRNYDKKLDEKTRRKIKSKKQGEKSNQKVHENYEIKVELFFTIKMK